MTQSDWLAMLHTEQGERDSEPGTRWRWPRATRRQPSPPPATASENSAENKTPFRRKDTPPCVVNVSINVYCKTKTRRLNGGDTASLGAEVRAEFLHFDPSLDALSLRSHKFNKDSLFSVTPHSFPSLACRFSLPPSHSTASHGICHQGRRARNLL